MRRYSTGTLDRGLPGFVADRIPSLRVGFCDPSLVAMLAQALRRVGRRTTLAVAATGGLASGLALQSGAAAAGGESIMEKLGSISSRLSAIETALGIAVPRKYIVLGSPEAAGLDLDFDLVLDACLAVNKCARAYPSIPEQAWRAVTCGPIGTPRRKWTLHARQSTLHFARRCAPKRCGTNTKTLCRRALPSGPWLVRSTRALSTPTRLWAATRVTWSRTTTSRTSFIR